MMNRRKFIGIAGTSLAAAAGVSYLVAETHNVTRTDIGSQLSVGSRLHNDENAILYYASLAPSGHNTQPWFVKHIERFHWLICNDKSRWLPAVDPTQRETVLSIGAFLQNLEYAAGHYGYSCQFDIVGKSNQDENMVDVKLVKMPAATDYDVNNISSRRTLRSGFLSNIITKATINYLAGDDGNYLHYFPSGSRETSWINDQTVEANIKQAARDEAQAELSQWIRFSGKDAKKHCDGLTTASMEIEGIPAFFVRNFYGKKDVMKQAFRDKTLDQVRDQVAHSAGWIVITSSNNSVAMLIETGMRLQRLLLKVRTQGIAIHPMTQILEETGTQTAVNTSTGITDPIQFLLRTGYVTDYPGAVSLRRSVDLFIRS